MAEDILQGLVSFSRVPRKLSFTFVFVCLKTSKMSLLAIVHELVSYLLLFVVVVVD